MAWTQLFAQVTCIFVCTVHLAFGRPSHTYLSPEMSDALHLLRPGERLRFAASCLGGYRCSEEEVASYSWESSHVDAGARQRFWHTYYCAWSEVPNDCPVDGGWSAWSEWGGCDTTCGDGTKLRYRACDWPLPSNGGYECHGQATSVTSCSVDMVCPPTEDRPEDSMQQRALKVMEPFNEENAELRAACMEGRCSYQQVAEMVRPRNLADDYWTNLICYKHSEGCAVDGGWSEWSTWSSCSSRCGTGKAYRSRRCNSPQPRHGGRSCEGPEYEEGTCFDDSCLETVGVLLTPWSMWSECSATCNEGVKTSTRRCHGSDVCDVGNGQVAAALTREIVCTASLCPEMGGWSKWGKWTVCTAICGQGRRMRERACNKPRPQGEGNDCVGEYFAVEECNHYAPFCEGIPKDVIMYEEWSPWSDCSAPCDGGMKIRHRVCPKQEHVCRGELYDLQMCNYDLPCKVDGGWSEWSEWSFCTVTCDEGETARHRQCSNPRPEFGGRSCRGEASQRKKCLVSECPANATVWSSWNEWSQCTVTCAGGTSTRTRGCLASGGYGGESTWLNTSSCIGEFKQINVCNFLPCPVDGNWASWGDWAVCSRSCGEGVVKRDRTCTDPAPAGGGEVCGGYGTEAVLCYQQPCPVPDEIVRTFDGAAFMMYRRAAAPSKHLLLYMRFMPSAPSGLLALRHEDAISQQVVTVGMANGRVRLYARIEQAETEVTSIEEVRLNKWNSVEVAISGGHGHVRVNDGPPVVSNFTLPLPAWLDWDQSMFIGGALPHLFPGPAREYVGFVGAVSALRVNYKEYTLHDIRPEWTGVGLPFVSFNVETKPADIDAQVKVFTGDEFTFLPSPNTTDGKLSFKITFRPDAPNGIILYAAGMVPGSFIAMTIIDCRVAMSVDLGEGTATAKSEEIALSKWAIVQLALRGTDAEMHVKGGPAVQVTVPGSDFAPAPTINIGGVSRPDKTVAQLTMGRDRGLVGAVYGVTINGDQYLMKETALNRHSKYLDSASMTLSAHYREVKRLRHGGVVLQCSYANIHHEQPLVTWLNGDKLLEDSDHITVFKPNIFLPHTSFLSLHALNADNEGLYACMVWYRGKAVITHAFGVSIYDPHSVEFLLESKVDLMIIGNVLLMFWVAIGIFALSCFRVFRRRYFFLDMMYQSIVFYLGLDSWACLRDPNVPDYATVLRVNATYDKDFSAREEKIKFDQALKKARREKLKEKTRELKDKLAASETEKGGMDGVKAKPADRVNLQTGGHRPKDSTTITVTPNEAPRTIARSSSKGAELSEPQHEAPNEGISSHGHSNVNQSAGVHQNLQRHPSDSLSDREINLRRLSHEIVMGKPESSTSGSSLGGPSPDMVASPAASNPGNKDSLSSLALAEDEPPLSLEEDEDQDEESEEPIYVNIDTIRERRRQSQPSTSSARFAKRASSTSSESESPPDIAPPKLVSSGEPVEVDMDTVRENWRKSKISEEILISSECDTAESSVKEMNRIHSAAHSTRERRKSAALQAGHDTSRLFSHRGSIGGAVAKLSEAVADDLHGENAGLSEIDEGAAEDDDDQEDDISRGELSRIEEDDEDGQLSFDSAPSAASQSDGDEDGSDLSDGLPDERDNSE